MISRPSMPLFLLSFLAMPLCAASSAETVRLSPVPQTSAIPRECRVVSVLHDSPAAKAGIGVGDVLQSLNGQTPADASLWAEQVAKAPIDSEMMVQKKGAAAERLAIRLNASRPRLGAVCDLTGWAKPGVTAAGNESLTLFNGPIAFTASGIVDKGLLFLRVRITNDTDHTLTIGPTLFKATDGAGAIMPVLSPKEVMCLLYGEKGAHLLALKKIKKDTLDSHGVSLLGEDFSAEERCPAAFGNGQLKDADSSYAEANAQYLATESLWEASFQPGTASDGLIYLKETARLPVTLTAQVDGRALTLQMGIPQASAREMKSSELARFFERQTRGASLRLSLKRGQVFVGKFVSYDSLEERVWFNATSGLLRSTSFSLETIRSAEPLEQIPAKPIP